MRLNRHLDPAKENQGRIYQAVGDFMRAEVYIRGIPNNRQQRPGKPQVH